MVRLDAILDEAKNDPFSANVTVLDTGPFYTIRGPSHRVFRARLQAAIAGSGDLIQVQELNADEGLEVIEPVKVGIHGGCWYLRKLTHSGETYPAGEAQYRSIVEALEAAIEWWQTETWCRGIMVRVSDVDRASGPL